MTVPACPAYCSRLRLRPRPPTDRKQETGTGSKHPDTAGPDTGMNGWADGRTDRQTDGQTDGSAGRWKRPSLSEQTLTEMQKGRSEKKKKLKKSYRSVYVPNLEAILLFWSLNHAHRHQNEKQWNIVLIFVTSWISLCRHINFSTIKQDGT